MCRYLNKILGLLHMHNSIRTKCSISFLHGKDNPIMHGLIHFFYLLETSYMVAGYKNITVITLMKAGIEFMIV